MKKYMYILVIVLLLIAILIILIFLGYGEAPAGAYRRSEYIPKLLENIPRVITVNGVDFTEGDIIPILYTCDGINVNPGIKWSNLPEEAVSLAILIYDVDAPKDYFIHWILVNLPSNTRQIPSGYEITTAVSGRNDFGGVGYGGPCPPSGERHKYIVVILALDIKLDLKSGFTFENFYNEAKGHIIGYGETYFYYSRK